MKVNINQFVLNHSKAPKGYGMWWFKLVAKSGEEEDFAITAQYGTAVKEAKRYAKEKLGSLAKITVMP